MYLMILTYLMITFIIAHHLGVHVCGHLEVLGGTNTAAYTGTNSIGFFEGTSVNYNVTI